MSSDRLLARLLGTVASLVLACASALAAPGSEAGRAAFLTVEEALALSFPKCEIVERTIYLTKEERKAAEELAHVEVPQSMLRVWVAHRDGQLVGTAYCEAHRVRTLKETVMIVVDPKGRIARFEILAFGEPPEYIPRGSWYQQLIGRELDDELELDRGIRGVSGATLTARASTQAARRILALHHVLGARPGGS